MLPPLSFSLLFFNYLFYSTFVFLLLLLVFIFSFFFFSFLPIFRNAPPAICRWSSNIAQKTRENYSWFTTTRLHRRARAYMQGRVSCIGQGIGDPSKNAKRNSVIVSRKRNSRDFVLMFLIVITTYYR